MVKFKDTRKPKTEWFLKMECRKSKPPAKPVVCTTPSRRYCRQPDTGSEKIRQLQLFHRPPLKRPHRLFFLKRFVTITSWVLCSLVIFAPVHSCYPKPGLYTLWTLIVPSPDLPPVDCEYSLFLRVYPLLPYWHSNLDTRYADSLICTSGLLDDQRSSRNFFLSSIP